MDIFICFMFGYFDKKFLKEFGLIVGYLYIVSYVNFCNGFLFWKVDSFFVE